MAIQDFPVTKTFTERFGTMHPLKGSKDEITMYSWDLIEECAGDRCRAVGYCHFSKSKRGKCRVMYWFLNGVVETFIRDQVLSQREMWKVGMQLMPMYKVWCKLLIFESSVSVDKVGYKNSKDEWRIHPIFKSIGDHVDKINKLELKLGLVRDEKKPGVEFVPPTQVRRKK